ncbi:hypothetical protein AB0N28_03495 [Streptomyces sp. NPDC051130]|uniref:hypothetical protein n=1 Tax=Streptomyces sp. NPDC051130 TaxID=3157223 RepID=UPI00341CE5F7
MTSSRQLLAAEAKGAEILHNGAPVIHWPRGKGDREPWLIYDGDRFTRYPASACVAYWPCERPN